MSPRFWTAVAAAACVAVPAIAQDKPQVDAAQIAQQARDAATDLTLSRFAVSVGMTPAQTGRLAPVLDQAVGKIRSAEDQQAAAITRLRATAEQARAQAAAGQVPSASLEQQYAAAAQQYETQRQRTRAAQVAAIRAALGTILTPQQFSDLPLNAGMLLQQARGQQFAFGGRGAGGFGGLLDRVRQMTPEEWSRMRARMARFGRFGRGRPGAGDGPGGDTAAPAGPGAQQDQFLSTLERVRQMSPEDYAVARPSLVQQYANQMNERILGRQDPNRLLDEFIDTYLLQAEAVKWARHRAGLTETPGGTQ